MSNKPSSPTYLTTASTSGRPTPEEIMSTARCQHVIYVTAKNHYEVGHAIGSTNAHWISDYLNSSDDVKTLRGFYATERGREIVENYLCTAEKFYPKIVSEIRGMADGSKQDFTDIFMLQIVSEITLCHVRNDLDDAQDRETSAKESTSKGCTDVLLNSTTCRVIGHNDDWTDDVASFVSLVHVTIENDDVIEEQFVSYVYPGYLPGFCFGMNKDLVITLDSVCPKQTNISGVSLLILLRALFTCSSIEECRGVMECSPVGCAYGMNINIAEINTREMCSMEVYPDKDQSRVHTKFIHPRTDIADSCSYLYHENAYKHTTEVNEYESSGSKRRDDRLRQMAPPETVDDVISMLGDTDNSLEPIYRLPNENHQAPTMKTSATAIFDLTKKVMMVYKSNPSTEKQPCLKMAFL